MNFYDWRLHLTVLVIVVISELIRTRRFQVGPGMVLLLPMLYALVLGVLATPRFLKVVNEKQMRTASPLITISVMMLVARLGTIVGPSLKQIASAGLTLVLQEFGMLFCPLVAMPIAVAIGMKREAVGGTFSICREGGIAVIGQVYGLDSPEGRGCLGTYIFGTLFGAIYMGLFAGLVASLRIFHPWALGMATGIGSASMMSAAAGAVAAALPEYSKDVLAFAAASNLLTAVDGVWSDLFLALPLANITYKFWRKVFRKRD
ncbi:MAG: DUF3100 domain-containing protein [Candidatus Fermentithermobacillus carboniphilus]|uniref:DUF3100 domain-containing protein n=1 Tax=Candidatus Fermentithermobacillus carboniphilus TaxID=3085328 RepID=A0AAT9LEX2_9FIRM|nr:MAG: DUF3100 domain-containing protein [Candidatus Fermentithermobacillus carboniphilus]